MPPSPLATDAPRRERVARRVLPQPAEHAPGPAAQGHRYVMHRTGGFGQRPFTNRIGVTANATLYNATAFNVEVDVSIVRSSVSSYLTDNYTVQSVPTTDNGYCTIYELYGEYPVNTLFGKVKTTIDQLTI